MKQFFVGLLFAVTLIGGPSVAMIPDHGACERYHMQITALHQYAREAMQDGRLEEAAAYLAQARTLLALAEGVCP